LQNSEHSDEFSSSNSQKDRMVLVTDGFELKIILDMLYSLEKK